MHGAFMDASTLIFGKGSTFLFLKTFLLLLLCIYIYNFKFIVHDVFMYFIMGALECNDRILKSYLGAIHIHMISDFFGHFIRGFAKILSDFVRHCTILVWKLVKNTMMDWPNTSRVLYWRGYGEPFVFCAESETWNSNL